MQKHVFSWIVSITKLLGRAFLKLLSAVFFCLIFISYCSIVSLVIGLKSKSVMLIVLAAQISLLIIWTDRFALYVR